MQSTEVDFQLVCFAQISKLWRVLLRVQSSLLYLALSGKLQLQVKKTMQKSQISYSDILEEKGDVGSREPAIILLTLSLDMQFSYKRFSSRKKHNLKTQLPHLYYNFLRFKNIIPRKKSSVPYVFSHAMFTAASREDVFKTEAGQKRARQCRKV